MHYLLWGHCVNSDVIVLDQGTFLREWSSGRKIQRSKTNTSKFTPWPKTRWYKVVIVINNHSLDIQMHFNCNLWRNTLSNWFLTHCLPTLVRKFWSVNAWWSSRNVLNSCVLKYRTWACWYFKRKCTNPQIFFHKIFTGEDFTVMNYINNNSHGNSICLK